MQKQYNKKLFILIMLVLATVIGFSFAMYNVVLKGQKENVITTKKLTFSYAEQLESLNLTSYGGKTDEVGKNQTNYYEFSVKALSSANETIDYSIYISKIINDYNFSEEDIRINLTKVVNNTENEVLPPISLSSFTTFNNIENTIGIFKSSFVFDGVTAEEQIDTYRLRIWLREDFDDSILISKETSGDEQNIKLKNYQFEFKLNVSTGSLTNLEETSANKPVLLSGMIPVYYDESTSSWKKAEETNSNNTYRWYSYASSGSTKGMWANAVTVTEATRSTYLNASVGTTINMDDINAMFVWIPRIKATTPSNYNGGTAANPGAIEVTFVDNTSDAMDAFTFKNQNLSGFWFGKFENSAETIPTAANTTLQAPIIKPNVNSLRYTRLYTLYYSINDYMNGSNASSIYGFSEEESYSSHLIKNSEWGTVAYLTQSIYGRCSDSTTCTEIGINNNASYITGYGAPAGSATTVTNGAYNTALGKDASTTGTIYGIYDMSGGAEEFVMGNYNKTIGSSGFANTWFTENDSINLNYIDIYTTTSAYTTSALQHALVETQGWYSDGSTFVASSSSSSYKWFTRGNPANSTTTAGIFNYDYATGAALVSNGTRTVITVN